MILAMRGLERAAKRRLLWVPRIPLLIRGIAPH